MENLASTAKGLPILTLADQLKDEWYQSHNPPFSRDELDKWKDDPVINVRQSLVQFAEEQLSKHGTDYYCRRAVEKLDGSQSFIVSDWRRKDEYEYFKQFGEVICWRVVRPNGIIPPNNETVEHELDDVSWRIIIHPN